jgi:hypothetical protein
MFRTLMSGKDGKGRRRRQPRVLAAAVALCMSACGGSRPEARVTLASSPVLTGLVFHGDCVAGWLLEATIRVSAGREESLSLDRLAYHFIEGDLAAGEILMGRDVVDRYGDGADRIGAGGSRDYRLGIRWLNNALQKVTLVGEVSGVGESGSLLQTFSFPDVPVVQAPLGPGLGACFTPPPS